MKPMKKSAYLADGQSVDGEEGTEAEASHIAHHESRRFDIEIGVRHKRADGDSVDDGDLAKAVRPG